MKQERVSKQSSVPVMADVSIDQPFNINNYHRDREWLDSMSTAGFTLVVNKNPLGVEYFDSTYADEWQLLYKQKHYVWVDPIVLNAMLYGNSDNRWSDIKLPDIRGVWKTAKRYGLVYGATFARTKAINKSLLSLAREDREFSDTEMFQLANWFDQFLQEVDEGLNLSEKELDVVKLLARDMNIEEISEALEISQSAIKWRLKQARDKVGCKHNYTLIAKAGQAKLL